VMAVATDGTLSVFAGDGFCGTAPTTGDARDQTLTVDGMALDEPHNRLVVIDRAGGLVRTVDLGSHQLGLLGGGGTKAPKLALGGKATDAILDPAVVSAAPDGTVAFVEAISQQVLSIDSTGTLNVVAASRKASGADCGTLSLDTCAAGCSVFYDA